MKKEGVFVMKKLFTFVLVSMILMFCGCNTEQTGNVDKKMQMAPNMEELKDHIGEYVTGDLISLPRVGLMADEYAKRDTDIPQKTNNCFATQFLKKTTNYHLTNSLYI